MVLAVACAAATFLTALTQLRDWDTFHHLAYGRDLLRRGGFAHEDPFLYPLAGLPSGAQPSWLSSVFIFLSWRLLGDAGPVYLAGALTALLFALLLFDALDGDDTVEGIAIAIPTLACALALFRTRAVARPELFADLLLVGTLIAIRGAAAGKRRLMFALPLVGALWANLHGSVLLGVAVLAIAVGVDGVLLVAGRLTHRRLAEAPDGRALILPVLALAGAVALAGLLSPFGFGALGASATYAARWMGVGPVAAGPSTSVLTGATIGELSPITGKMWAGPFGWLVVACGASFLVGWRRWSPRELVTCAALVELGVHAARFAPVALIVLAPVTARNLRAGLLRARGPGRRWLLPGVVVLGVAATMAAGYAMFHRVPLWFGTGVARHVPVRPARYLQSIGFDGRLYDTYHFGGYLEWTLDKQVFQDGRGNLRREDSLAALAGPTERSLFASLDARYRFDALVVQYPRPSPASYRLLATTRAGQDWGADRTTWALVAFDDGGMLYLRREGRYADAAARDEYPVARPANPVTIPVPPAERSAAIADFERSLREVPDCTLCATNLAFLYLADGRPADATPLLLQAVQGLPETATLALMGLSFAAEDAGDLAQAESRLREVLAVAAEPTWPTRELARLLARQRRFEEALAVIRQNLARNPRSRSDLGMAARIARGAGDEAAARAYEAALATH